MPVHDWRRVAAGTYHAFHTAWITHLQEAFNGGLLPEGYYAMAEQHAGGMLNDVLALTFGDRPSFSLDPSGPVAVLDTPPAVSRKRTASPNAAFRAARRTLTVRHVSGHRIVALVEIASPANKDRPTSVNDFVTEVHGALRQQCHVLLIDLFPPGRHDPRGLHGAIWEVFDPDEEPLPEDQPLTLASYVAGPLPEAYVEPLAVGALLPEMPLFLERDYYIRTPLEATYEAAYRGMPAVWRAVLEGREPPPG